MSTDDVIDASEIASAIDELAEARKEMREARANYDGYSFDYSGYYSGQIESASTRLTSVLNSYIDQRVKAAIDAWRDKP